MRSLFRKLPHPVKRFVKQMLFRQPGAAVRNVLQTSISDNYQYPQFCLTASTDLNQFMRFRRNPVYNQILEHVSENQGLDYLNIISLDDSIVAKMSEFQLNDMLGSPRVYTFPGIGDISPTTLRYVKVLADLKRLFRTLNGLNVVEIGVGYGGQCRIVNAFFQPSSYVLVDIKPALLLAQRFLDHYIMNSSLSYFTMNELKPTAYDLVISNYAFSELPRSFQDAYLTKVIRNARMGYITYNEISPGHFHSYTASEIASMIPGSKILPEVPLTSPKNCIIVWGQDGVQS
jgi:putative sugar O-methyltransferase